MSLTYEYLVDNPNVTEEMMEEYTKSSFTRWITIPKTYAELSESQKNDLFLVNHVHPRKLSSNAARIWFDRCPIDPLDEYRFM